jgi:hypothetical protein
MVPAANANHVMLLLSLPPPLLLLPRRVRRTVMMVIRRTGVTSMRVLPLPPLPHQHQRTS